MLPRKLFAIVAAPVKPNDQPDEQPKVQPIEKEKDDKVDAVDLASQLMPVMNKSAILRALKKSPVILIDNLIAKEDVEAFAVWFMSKRRLPTDIKQKRLLELGIATTNLKKGPIEEDVLSMLEAVIPYAFHRQYRVGPYRLDAFIERIRLGIEIDEGNHRAYVDVEEKQREQAIQDANISVLRFNPDAPEHQANPGLMLIQKVWKHWASVEFRAFQRANV